ncbi:MAG: hypothetical protein NTV86_21720 [Planctomycetota bacterium]|nr:hypothetical protein [Planctomycetota bacterium]
MKRHTGTRTWAVAASVAALWASAAWGQVMPVQGGGALDANPGMGTYGQNARPIDTRINSQLYIDGQVTGLGGFHAKTGYLPSNQLQMTVPSADLSGFNARSVGIRQAMEGSTYITSPYYNPSSSLPRSQDILSGVLRPGQTVASPAGNPTYYKRLYTDAVESFRPLLPDEVSSKIPLKAPLAPQIGSLPALPETALDEPDKASAKVRARLAPLFIDVYSGMPSPEASQELAKQLYEMQAREMRGGMPLDSKVKLAVSDLPLSALEAEAEAQKKREKDQTLSGLAAAAAQDVHGTGAPGSKVQPAAGERPANAPKRGEDVFLDILESMQKVKTQDKAAAGEAPAPAREPRLTNEQKRQEALGLRPPVDIEGRQIHVHSLAGRGTDQYNTLKREGQEFLLKGRFYDAVNRFQDALIINPDDPTGHVGLALGTFGAGEYRRSAVILRTALERFPALMQIHFDVLTWLHGGGPQGLKTLELGMADINARLMEKDGTVNPSLAALGAWIQWNVGKTVDAQRLAGILKEAAPKDALYQAYANHILAGTGETAAPK